MSETITLHTDFMSVAQTYKRVLEGEYDGPNRKVAAMERESWRRATDEGWHGASAQTMLDWIDNGYVVPGMDLPNMSRSAPRSAWKLDEEGEIQVDLALSGFDLFCVNRKPRKRQPGIRLDIELAVLGVTTPETLAGYAEWIGRLIYGMQDRGIALDVNVVSRCHNIGPGLDSDVTVSVATAGKRTDFKAWSAILSPGGFRHLIFCSRLMNADHNGRQIMGMGGSYGQKWGVEYDPKTRTMTVRCRASSSRFPTDEMNRQLGDALAQI
jgi:hypothetical protein